MIKRLFFLLLPLCAGTLCVPAQTAHFKGLDKAQYKARVKFLDEFFARFNGKEKREDLPEEYSDQEANILLLFDLSKYKSKSDSGYVSAKQFAQQVVSQNIQLNFEDTDWYANIKCHGQLGQKKIDFNMSLCVEKRGNAMYKWVITNVEGDIFQTSRDWPHKELFIMPNDNEQFFLSLRKTTTETYLYIDDYVKRDYKADPLSTFLCLVRSNQLKIEYVTDVEFVFQQVPDYIFTVKYFERDNHNVGWLIDTCKKISDKGQDTL